MTNGPSANELPVDYEQILDVLSQGVIVLDRELNVLMWNRWMEEHSSVSRKEVIGKKLTEIFPELGKKGFLWKVEGVFKLGNFAFFSQQLHGHLFPLASTRYLQSDFEQMQQNAVIAPLRDRNSEVAYVCVSVVDCTDTAIFHRRLQETAQLLDEMSRTDPLTHLANRRQLFQRLDEELSRVLRHARPLGVALVDVDHFKQVNDTFGHMCGDEVLVAIARILCDGVRKHDTVGRYGGEEFCFILPEIGKEQAALVLDRLRARVAATPIQCQQGPVTLTLSGGVTCTTGQERFDADALLRQADDALNQAKKKGRNRVEVYAARPKAW